MNLLAWLVLLLSKRGLLGSAAGQRQLFISDIGCLLGFACNQTVGCTQSIAANYDPAADLDDGSCDIIGCTNPASSTYNPVATTSDGCSGGCTSPVALNYDSIAAWLEGNCSYACDDPTALNFGQPTACVARVYGCMVPIAGNYDSHANTPDNAQCVFVSPPPSPLPTFGCTDQVARNFDSLATASRPEDVCTYTVRGCTDSAAANYYAAANEDDASCITRVEGCIEASAANFDSLANTDDGSCQGGRGCTYPPALNYDSLATVNDGSCRQAVAGCLDSRAATYDPVATFDDSNGTSCVMLGCTDSLAHNYWSEATNDDSSCASHLSGCTNSAAENFDANADFDDGSCDIFGCMDSSASNFEAAATTEPFGTCEHAGRVCEDSIASNYGGVGDVGAPCRYGGCMESTHPDYDSRATFSTGCASFVAGCTDSAADNYNVIAVVDDGSCAAGGCLDPGATNYASRATYSDGSCVGVVVGCTDSLARNYVSTATSDSSTCQYDSPPPSPAASGCPDSSADNYDSNAVYNPGVTDAAAAALLCVYSGCTDITALNYDPSATIPDPASCVTRRPGCTDSTSATYVPSANVECGSDEQAANACDPCEYGGCTDSLNPAFDASATFEDSSCDTVVLGCTDSNSTSYTASANREDGSCRYAGCTDPLATNYNPSATHSDFSCVILRGCTDSHSASYSSAATHDDGSCSYVGCSDSAALNFDSMATHDHGGLCEYASPSFPPPSLPSPSPPPPSPPSTFSDGVLGSAVSVDGDATSVLAPLLGPYDGFGTSLCSLGTEVSAGGTLTLAVGAQTAASSSSDRLRTGAVILLATTPQGSVAAAERLPANDSALDASLGHNDRFGSSIATIGDLDGDGLPELAVGAKGDGTAGAQAGAAYVLFLTRTAGNSTLPTVSRHVKLPSPGGAYGAFGSSIAAAGDLDGDGIPDLVVGAPASYPRLGAVLVLSLHANGTMRAYQELVPSATSASTASELFGTAIAVSAPLFEASPIAAAALISGSSSSIASPATRRQLQRLSGERILAVGAPGGGSDGLVHLYRLGAPTLAGQAPMLPTVVWESVLDGSAFLGTSSVRSEFGSALSYAFDYDGNGEAELVVGAPGASGTGALVIHFLEHGGIVAWRTAIVEGSAVLTGNQTTTANFGRAIAAIGALDATDIVGDLAAGALDDTFHPGSGLISILFMQPAASAPRTNPPPRPSAPPQPLAPPPLFYYSPQSPMPLLPPSSPPPMSSTPPPCPSPPPPILYPMPVAPPAPPEPPPVAPVDRYEADSNALTDGNADGLSVGVIIAIVVGSFIVLLVFLAMVWRCRKPQEAKPPAEKASKLQSVADDSRTPRDLSSAPIEIVLSPTASLSRSPTGPRVPPLPSPHLISFTSGAGLPPPPGMPPGVANTTTEPPSPSLSRSPSGPRLPPPPGMPPGVLDIAAAPSSSGAPLSSLPALETVADPLAMRTPLPPILPTAPTTAPTAAHADAPADAPTDASSDTSANGAADSAADAPAEPSVAVVKAAGSSRKDLLAMIQASAEAASAAAAAPAPVAPTAEPATEAAPAPAAGAMSAAGQAAMVRVKTPERLSAHSSRRCLTGSLATASSNEEGIVLEVPVRSMAPGLGATTPGLAPGVACLASQLAAQMREQASPPMCASTSRTDARGNQAPCGTLATMGSIRRIESFGKGGSESRYIASASGRASASSNSGTGEAADADSPLRT